MRRPSSFLPQTAACGTCRGDETTQTAWLDLFIGKESSEDDPHPCEGRNLGELRQEIGLGQAAGIESVEILWPASGTRQVVRDLKMDQLYQVREGDPEARPIPLRVFRLGGTRPTPGTGAED
jgi:hypothetical protein